VRALPLLPDRCSLTAEGLSAQAHRAAAVRASVLELERRARTLRVRFAADVDEAVVARLVEAERGCCSFLELAWDARARELSVAAPEGTDAEAVGTIASLFEEAA
jgi:hypothetical protein